MKIGRKIGIGVVVILLAVAGGVFYLVGNLDGLVKKTIEKYGSQAAGTRVTVSKVHIDLGQARGKIRDLQIANPGGFSSAPLFRLGEIELQLDPATLTGPMPTIDEIRILAPQLRFEVNSRGQTNLSVFKRGLAADAKDGAATGEGGSGETRLLVKKVIIADAGANIDLTAVGGKTYVGTLPPVNLTDLGGSRGVTPRQLGRIVLTALSEQLEQEAARRGIDAALRSHLDNAAGKLQRKLDEKLGSGSIDADKTLKKIFGN